MRVSKTKKLKVLSVLLAGIFGMTMLASCTPPADNSQDDGDTKPIVKENYYTVTFLAEDNTTKLREQTVKDGDLAFDWTPEKTDYDFNGWYTDSARTQLFSFATQIKGDLTLYAKFTQKEPEPVEDVVEQFPVTLAKDGMSFTYGYEGEEQTVEIGEKAIYVDGRLSDEEIEGYANVYNSFKQAMDHLVDGTETDPMVMYVAPYVYWIHNPDSPSTSEAYGIVKSCENLQIIGLTDDARNVVIAANYGHNEGFDGGNWTMFNITGDGLTLKNITFGDYCNVDLEYPLNPSLNRPKRTNNVTQGQIGSYSGDKLYAENVRFISRLNMMPFISSERALYVNCHMESTDDSLNGSSKAVYLGCDFEFYSGKPWGGSSGVTLLDCTMKLVHYNVTDKVEQYLAKGAGPFTVIDCAFTDEYTVPVTIGWSDILSDTFRSYYSNVTHNGKAIALDNGGKDADKSVDLTGTEALKAFKLTDKDGTVIYNVYNLLRGDDDWDPLGQKEKVTALEAQDIPTSMKAYTQKTENPWFGTSYTTTATIESGVDTVTAGYDVLGPQSTDYNATSDVTWSIDKSDEKYVRLTPSEDGKTCLIEGINQEEETVTVIVTAKDASGLEGAVAITVRPTILPAPTFITQPVISQNADGTAKVDYTLELDGRADMSRIIWSVCDNAAGDNPIEIAVGRGDTPLTQIPLSQAYVGKYLKVSIETKTIRSDYAAPVSVVSQTPVAQQGITVANRLTTDFSTFSTAAQPQVIEGMWSVDGYIPADTQPGYIPLDGTEESTKYSAKVNNWTTTSDNSWAYGTGAKNGFLDYTGIYQVQRGARLRYTPIGETFGDMDVTLKVAPGKTASQGFGSDYQYMDIMIKFDTETLTGYGLRIYRTSGDSCEFVLMQHADGKSKEICEPIRSSTYLTECTIHVWTEGNKLYAHVESSQPQSEAAANMGYAEKVDLVADITANTEGGFCLLHTGTVGDNSTYIGSLDIKWN